MNRTTVAFFEYLLDALRTSNQRHSQTTRLASGTTHRGREYAKEGLDVDEEDKRAAESFGMTVEEYGRKLAENTFGGGKPAQIAEDVEPAMA